MTEQNRKYITKEVGKLLSDIWRIKGLAEQEYGPQHKVNNCYLFLQFQTAHLFCRLFDFIKMFLL